MIAGALEVQMFANIARLAKDMAEAKSTVERSMKGIEGAVASAKSALAALGVGLSIGYFVSLIKGSIDAADHLNDLSKTTDIAVEKLAGLKLLAKQSGGDLDGLAQSINKLSQNMGKDADKFKALGVTAKDPLEAFKQLADIFVAIKDPQLRAAVAAQALGKSWAGAAPALSEGSAKIAEIVEKGARLSGMTKDMAVNADEFNDKMAELNTTLGATRTKLVADMLPGMNDIAAAMKEAAKEGGLLLTVWVALGGVMANILGLTDAQRVKTRLEEINKQLEITRKQIESGSLNPKGASSSVFGFLIPDVKLSAAALAEAMKTRRALEAEKARLTPPPPAAPPAPDPAAAATAAAKAAAFLKGEKEAKLAAAELLKYENALKSLEDQLGKLNEQTVEEKMVNDLARGSLKGLTDEHQKHLIAVAKLVDQENVRKVAREAYVKAMEMDLALEQEVADLMAARATKEGDAIKAQHDFLENMRFEASLIGKTNVARETAIALRALEASSSAKVSGGIDKESAEYARLVAKIREEIQAKTAAEALNPKILEQMEFEIKLIGMTNTEREQAIALRALELTGVDQTTDAYKEYVAQLKNVIAAKTAADEMKALHVGMWQDIDRVAHDTFTSIFDSGKSAFDRLRDTLKNGLYSLLYQLTIRPILINIATSVGGAGVAQAAFPGATSGAGGIGNLLSTGNSLYNGLSGNSSNLLNNVGSFLGMGGSVAGSGLTLAGSAGAISGGLGASGIGAIGAASSGLSTIGLTGLLAAEGAGAAGAGLGLATAGVEAASIGAGAASAGIGGAAMGALAAAAPYIAAAVAIAGALGLFGGKKKAAVGTGYNFSGGYSGAAGTNLSLTGLTTGGNDAMPTANHIALLNKQIGASVTDLERMATGFGFDAAGLKTASASFNFTTPGIGQAQDDAGQAAVVVQVIGQMAKSIIPDLEDYVRENESLIATFTRLGTEMQLTDKIIEIVGKDSTSAFGAVGLASLKMRDDLITLMGGLDTATNLTNSYYENFFTAAERQSIDLGRVNTAMAELGITGVQTREEFRRLVEAQDLSTRAGREMFAALLTLAPAFAAVTQSMDEAAAAATTLAGRVTAAQSAALKAVSDQLSASRTAAGETSRLADTYRGIAESLRQAVMQVRGIGSGSGASLKSTFATAMTGDIAALSKLPQAAQDFLAASLATSSTATDYARDQARVISMLTRAGVVATVQASDQDRLFALHSAEVVILERIRDELEKPSPDLAVLNEQRALLGILGSYSSQQLTAIVADAETQGRGIDVVADLLRELVDLATQDAEQKRALEEAAALQRQITAATAVYNAQKSISDTILQQFRSVVAAQPFGEQIAGQENIAAGAAFAYQQFSYIPDDAASLAALARARELQDQYMAAFAQAYALYGAIPGHAAGLSYVPYDNYMARLHQGEAVLSSNEALTWRAQVSGGSGNSARLEALVEALLEESKAMRAEMRSGILTVARHTKKSADIADRVTEGGTSIRVTADVDDPLPVATYFP